MRRNYFSAILLFFLCAFVPLTAQEAAVPKLFWQQVLGGSILGQALVRDGTITAVCDGGIVKSLSNAGQVLWEYKAGGRLVPFLTQSDLGVNYVCRANGILFAINRSGNLLWKTNLKSPIVYNPIAGFDGRVFVFLQKKIICYSARGQCLWQLDFDSAYALPPRSDNAGGVILVLKDASLLRIDAFGMMVGIPLAVVPAAVVPLAQSANFSVMVFFPDKTIKIFTNFNSAGLDAGVLLSPPLTAEEYENNVVVLSQAGELSLVNNFGSILWTSAPDTQLISSGDIRLMVNNAGIYVLAKNIAKGFGNNGEVKWEFPINQNGSFPALGDDGILYTSGKNWVLSAYKTGDVFTGRKTIKPKLYGLNTKSRQIKNALSSDIDYGNYLKIIAAEVKNGTVGESEIYYTGILLNIANGNNLISQTATSERYRNRMEALRLLGLMGSPEVIPALSDLFLKEKDNTAKAFIADTIGSIAFDIEGQGLTAFSSVIYGSRKNDDVSLLCAISRAIGRICLFQGMPLAEKAIPMLTIIKENSHSMLVKRTAQYELDVLFKNSL